MRQHQMTVIEATRKAKRQKACIFLDTQKGIGGSKEEE
jgi:hypothetical protein